MWEILLPMTEDCLALTKKDLQYSKSRIQRLEMYPDQRFWSAQFYPRPAGWRLLNAIWNHLKINPDKKIQEWHYYLMMDSKGFNINPPPTGWIQWQESICDRLRLKAGLLALRWKWSLVCPPKTKMDIMKQIDSLPTGEMNKTDRNKNQDGTIFFSGWKSEDSKVVTKKGKSDHPLQPSRGPTVDEPTKSYAEIIQATLAAIPILKCKFLKRVKKE